MRASRPLIVISFHWTVWGGANAPCIPAGECLWSKTALLLFKTPRIEEEWASDRPVAPLRSLIKFLVDAAESRFGQNITLSCVYRTPEEDVAIYHDPKHRPGVHTLWRGVDVSAHGFAWKEIKALVLEGNGLWAYDAARPWLICFLFEGVDHPGSTAAHIHVQVSATTGPRPPVASG